MGESKEFTTEGIAQYIRIRCCLSKGSELIKRLFFLLNLVGPTAKVLNICLGYISTISKIYIKAIEDETKVQILQ